jgi:L-lactate utilization protein LutB
MSYDTLASQEIVSKTSTALQKKGYTVMVVENGSQALDAIKKLIPNGASIMNGASATLEEIGYVEYLKFGKHHWNDLHAVVTAESNPVKRQILRKQALTSDYYLGSVHALTETGDFVIGSNTGSQLPHIVFSSPNLIFVVGTQKIVPTLTDAIKRLKEYDVPLEDAHMRKLYNIGTMLSKIVIFQNENPRLGRKVTVILVGEKLGY